MKKRFFGYALAIAATALTASCSGEKQWEVSGTTSEESNGKTVYLESMVNGGWSIIDSATIADAAFSFKGKRPQFPDIYRLTIDGTPLYFPIDSIDVITIDATYGRFDMSRISGSVSADMIQRINDVIAGAALSNGQTFSDSIKREIAKIMTENLGGIAAYYAVNKQVGNTPLFDPQFSFDKRIIGGVATQFVSQHPDDPHSRQLESAALNNMRLFPSSTGASIEAQEIPFFEMSLRDAKGEMRSLTDTWDNSNVVVLNFTLLTAEESPAFNVMLNNIYEKYSKSGLEIYQVGCDENEFAWETAAKNLPWAAVYNSPINQAANLLNYNISALPTTFVISHDGNRMERVEDITKLDSVVARML